MRCHPCSGTLHFDHSTISAQSTPRFWSLARCQLAFRDWTAGWVQKTWSIRLRSQFPSWRLELAQQFVWSFPWCRKRWPHRTSGWTYKWVSQSRSWGWSLQIRQLTRMWRSSRWWTRAPGCHCWYPPYQVGWGHIHTSLCSSCIRILDHRIWWRWSRWHWRLPSSDLCTTRTTENINRLN